LPSTRIFRVFRRLTSGASLRQRDILLFWIPLAATWILMAAEGPFLAAVIARLPEATYNLAAHGVAFALAVMVESPVIMLMSAATALVRDEESFVRLRRFSWGMSALGTVLVGVVMVPAVFGWLTGTLMRLPDEVVRLTRGALWCYVAWPAAIGYRRFLQGVMIRAGRTRLVAYGTGIRLAAMATAGTVCALISELPGAWIGALALNAGVVAEAVVSRFMAAGTLREIRGGRWTAPRDRSGAGAGSGDSLRYRDITAFYIPLALTSLIGLSVQPMLTFFMGNAVRPVESLAVFPVVHALGFVFRALGLAYQDAAIALMGDRLERRVEVGRFARKLGLATSAVLAVVALTPLSHVWYVGVSGLSSELATYAWLPTILLVPLPALSVLLSFQRATLVLARRTRSVTIASAVEVAAVAGGFVVLGWGLGWMGVTAAFGAFLLGRCASNAYLALSCRAVLARRPQA
jgi:hypothetical protein